MYDWTLTKKQSQGICLQFNITVPLATVELVDLSIVLRMQLLFSVISSNMKLSKED